MSETIIQLPEDGAMPRIPDDEYEAEYRAVVERQSSPDSLAMGHWVWRMVLVGYRGKHTGVMLSPEWCEALEFEKGEQQ